MRRGPERHRSLPKKGGYVRLSVLSSDVSRILRLALRPPGALRMREGPRGGRQEKEASAFWKLSLSARVRSVTSSVFGPIF